jgi:hypothetical protein
VGDRYKGLGISKKLLVAGLLVASLLAPGMASALGSQQNPQNGSVGLEGKVNAPPPTQAPTISTPGNGQTVTHIPITVSGLCKTGLLVKVFSNNIFVGSAQCTGGSFSIPVDLFSGRNDLVVRQYDALDQASPDSNVVSVTFTDAQFLQFGTRVTLNSSYAQLGAAPGSELDWPITISGGVGPYALSVDWGDGTAPDLQSVSFAGPLTIKHVYKSAGIYKVTVQATDKNGTTAFLQLVGVGTGKVGQGSSGSGSASTPSTAATTTKNSIWVFVPFLFLFPLIFLSLWLVRRHELFLVRYYFFY